MGRKAGRKVTITKFTFTYGETRSHSYQAVRADVAVEVTLDEGEDYDTAFKAIRKQVRAQVADTADKSLGALLENKRGDI